ncbi:hypothetical protein P168DRAFT_321304 [Aspergillus campestris IBT 28561]|uniref:GPI inositol-deacylase winged helix domain-containing protein n=1 Tax=Aspergillus campestris (strain IBT 28561) TaxID=1392248 RepID=A0A2I1CVS8_ASPC2|nr:uncharacterized protein P168DRAFT_321304 [Aspergillus campestris IBT 28561]PKY01730.1 hypothetical protein P168DRAFT_321304 [Aspergillus campestris IBT 28561]
MARLPGFVVSNSMLQEEIKTEIMAAVDGMFLLARLHLDSLVCMRAPKAIRNALKKLPQGSNAYDSAYDRAMERIKGQVPSARELAEQTIAWITCAKRQLAIPELLHALAVEVSQPDFDEENLSQVADILSVCAGLVTVDEESGTIRLVHYTTQEYFARTRKDWFPDAETAITRACVSYLSFQTFGSGVCRNHSELLDRLDMYEFYEYSACHWGHHAHEALKPCPEVIPFLTCNSKVNASLQMLQREEFRHSQALWRVSSSGLHLAVMFGLEKAVQATNGHLTVVEQLLNAGADPNAKDSSGSSPAYMAALEMEHAIVDELLRRGADPCEYLPYREQEVKSLEMDPPVVVQKP